MSAYFIIQINITNPENYKDYIPQVTPLVKKFGGEYIVRGGKSENVEGRLNYSRKLSNQFRKSRSEVYSELDGWIDWFRDLALIKNELPDYILFRENIEAYNNLSNNIEIEAIVDSINLLFQTKENLDKNVSTNLVLDVMLLELPILR